MTEHPDRGISMPPARMTWPCAGRAHVATFRDFPARGGRSLIVTNQNTAPVRDTAPALKAEWRAERQNAAIPAGV